MITKQEIIEILEDVIYSNNSLNPSLTKFEEIADQIVKRNGWKPMDTAPKDKGILVYNKPKGKYGIKPDMPCCLAVEWSTWSYEWVVIGSLPDREGDYPVASYPVAWMELPEYDN